MKRTRSSSAESGAASVASSMDDSRSPSSSASSTTSSSAVEEFEEPSALPLLLLLNPVLALLKEREVFADALKRLAKEKPESMDVLTELHRTTMVQYDVVLMPMTREAILLTALTEARRTGATLPSVWMLRWTSKPQAEHGPFTDDVIQKWGSEGFFSKKVGELRDINAVKPAWVPAVSATISH